ncbi:hypothetical protein KI387_030716, partial [Taxus chinensis]
MPPPFSPARDINRTPHNCKRLNYVSIIPPTDRGFESQEPMSPKVSCIGHIKMKPPQLAKPSKLKKLMLGRHRKNNKAEEEDTVKGEEGKLGNTPDSYEAKFGSVYVEEGPIVAKSESFMLEGAPKEEFRSGAVLSPLKPWKPLMRPNPRRSFTT